MGRIWPGHFELGFQPLIETGDASSHGAQGAWGGSGRPEPSEQQRGEVGQRTLEQAGRVRNPFWSSGEETTHRGCGFTMVHIERGRALVRGHRSAC
jgi:hypothetical protein